MSSYDNLSTSGEARDPATGDGVVDVVIAAVVRRGADGGAQLLITQRPGHVVYAGYWELPGGKVDAHEGLDAALRRELMEELGVRIRVGEPLPIIEHVYAHGHVRLHPFRCALAADSPEPRNLHVVAHRWVGPADLADYRFPEANDALIAQLARELR